MHIYYRISSYLSMHKNPFSDDKNEINLKCLNSFLNSIGGCDKLITFITNGLDKDWCDKHLKPYGTVIEGNIGNEETFWEQLDLTCTLHNEEKVMFVEDDYLWRPNTLQQIEDALDTLPIIFPYDHPGHHTEERFKNQAKRITMVNGFTYHDVPSNTLTFATKAYVIKQNYEKIKTFGVRDHEMWQSLGIDMWSPNYSICSHLVENILSSNVKWEDLWT